MKNRHQFIHRSSAVLLACGIVTSLLAGLAAAQQASEQSPWLDYAYKIEINDLKGPEWSKGLPLYQAFLHRHTEEGTINAFRRELPRLKQMGVGIVWLMPIHPTGNGNPFCIVDHFGVDESLGTKADLKQLLDDVHDSGMYALLGVVPNHTSFDNPLTTSHPEYYIRGKDGAIAYTPPWKTIAQLDFSKQEVRDYITSYLEYWADFGFDGFRCDVAIRVPDRFWAEAIPRINEKHPDLLWLGEGTLERKESMHAYFDVTYDRSIAPYLWKILWKEWPATKLDSLMKIYKPFLEEGALLMRHVDDHDIHNRAAPPSYTKIIPGQVLRQRGGVYERYGEGWRVANVLCATLPGKYMIFNGQEANYRDPLPHDTTIRKSIEWGDKSMVPFYKSLLELHQNSPAIYEGTFYQLKTNLDDSVFAFARGFGNEKVLVLANLSGENRVVQIQPSIGEPEWQEYFTSEQVRGLDEIELNPYGYKVYFSNDYGDDEHEEGTGFDRIIMCRCRRRPSSRGGGSGTAEESQRPVHPDR